MAARQTHSWSRAAGLAAITGCRTALGPALVCRSAVRSAPLRACVTLASALELIGDKLPGTPDRTAPLGLALRIASGAGVARALVRRGRRGRRSSAGALALGAAVAVLGAFVGLRVRRALTRRLGGGTRANAIAGALEDAALIMLGTRLAAPAR